MVSPLDRKLLRDLWAAKGQVAAIAAVIAVGVMVLVMFTGLVLSLDETRRAYYERHGLADVVAPLERAPRAVLDDLAELPGVARAEGRSRGAARIDLPGRALPVQAVALSLPQDTPAALNGLRLAEGGRPAPGRNDEVLVLESFARANGLGPGDRLSATMNGTRRSFVIAGLAQSPEFLYTTPPGELAPDDARFGVIWMPHKAVAALYDMEGAFNEAILSLQRGARAPPVLDAVDRLLEPYGGQGAYPLAEQTSNRFVSEEIRGLEMMSRAVPPAFLAIAAFLLYIVVWRMVQAEREEIGLLKAFGYTDAEVAGHYAKFVLAIALAGALLGALAGLALGRATVSLYIQYFKFPFLVFRLDPAAVVLGGTVSVAAAAAGGLVVLRQVFRLQPAEAMRPPAPPDYSRAGRIGAGLAARLDQPTRMVLRRLTRQPLRMGGAVAGIAVGMGLCAAMITIHAGFERTVRLGFEVVNRSDVTVTFTHPLSEAALYRIARMEGVRAVEPQRHVPVAFRHGLETHRGAISGLVERPELFRALDEEERAVPLRADGLVLGDALADILGAAPGDVIEAELREGARPVLRLPVAAVAASAIGTPAYLELSALNRALGEGFRASDALLTVDAAQSDALVQALAEMPFVAGASSKAEARAALQELMDSGMGTMRFINMALAFIVAFGVVYNAARIAYAERARDLASLSVMGFSRGEVTFVLLGELVVVTLLALPIGSAVGYGLTLVIAAAFSNELYQVQALFSAASHGYAALVVLAALLVSGLLVRRDIARADILAVLKTRE